MATPTDPTPRTNSTTPKHLWIVCVVTLIWNAFGAFDYLMTVSQNEAYMSSFTPEQLAYFYSFPTWALAAWAIAIWSAVLGSVALLMRRGWAVGLFALSILGMIVSSVYTFVLSDGLDIMGGVGHLIFMFIIWIVAIVLYLYAHAQKAQGVLR